MAVNKKISTLKKQLKRALHSRREFIKIQRPFEWSKLKFVNFLMVDFGTEKYLIKKQHHGWEIILVSAALPTVESVILNSEEAVSDFLKEKLNNVYLKYIEKEARKAHNR